MTSRDEEAKSMARVDRAHKVYMEAFFKMNSQFYPNGSGIVSEDAMTEYDAANEEWKSAKDEMDRMTAEISNGTRN